MNFQMARTNMVEQQVRPWSVVDDKILATLAQISRENFVPKEYLGLAYCDTPIPLLNNHSMLPPKVVGRALQALNFTGVEKALEIGTGTGYITACLSKLALEVISVEIEPALIATAQINLDALHLRNVFLEQGDAVLGWHQHAPYDVILATGSYPLGVPQVLCEQLAPQGRLFAFIGRAPTMQAVIIERMQNQFNSKVLFETVVPALINAPQPTKFQF